MSKEDRKTPREMVHRDGVCVSVRVCFICVKRDPKWS